MARKRRRKRRDIEELNESGRKLCSIYKQSHLRAHPLPTNQIKIEKVQVVLTASFATSFWFSCLLLDILHSFFAHLMFFLICFTAITFLCSVFRRRLQCKFRTCVMKCMQRCVHLFSLILNLSVNVCMRDSFINSQTFVPKQYQLQFCCFCLLFGTGCFTANKIVFIILFTDKQ